MITIGFFDGVHLGHRDLLRQLREKAEERGLTPRVLTFQEHPALALGRPAPKLLTPVAEKRRLLENEGFEMIVLPFTPSLAAMTAPDFLDFLKEKYQVRAVLMGYNHRFGRPSGDENYEEWGKNAGVEVLRATEFKFPGDGEQVSSSRIRQALEQADLSRANRLLGRPYDLVGMVVEGRKIGRDLGFPTANILPSHSRQLIPSPGVYSCRAILDDGTTWKAAVNIGRRPTLNNGEDITIEAHLPKYFGDLYGQHVRLEFLEFMRAERQFESLEALKLQLREDVDKIKNKK